jgi:CheY-like chemotaxis protein
LSISSKLIELMGGQIWVKSKPGKGSEFHFTVKLEMSPMAEEQINDKEEKTRPLPGRVSPRQTRRYRILLAEDNLINQMVAKRMLENQGHTITTARDGKETLEIWKRGTFDLVLMDLHMPVMDGLKATASIRRQERTQKDSGHIPIIAMTARVLAGDRELCMEAGMDGYIPKPLDPEFMFGTIDRVVNGNFCENQPGDFR